MNEQEIAAKLTSYANELGTCTKRPTSRRRALPLVVAGTCTVLAVSMFALWPRDAVAATLDRVSRAIKNAKTMEATQESRRKDGAWREFQHIVYADGNWKMTTFKGSAMERDYILSNGQAFTSYKRLPHATTEPIDPGFHMLIEGTEADAIDFAKQQIDVGEVSTPRKVKLLPHSPIAGREVYGIEMKRDSDQYHAVLLVDKETDLPIESLVDVYWEDNGMQHYRQRYRFNHPLPRDTFVYPTNRPILDIPTEQAKLAIRWKNPIATFADTNVLDACITQDGAIWITVTLAGESEWATLPRRVIGGDPAGYAVLSEINPSEILGKARRFTLSGRRVVVVPFMPLTDGPAPTKEVSFGFDRAHMQWGMQEKVPSSPIEGLVTLKLRQVPSDRPEFFSALDLDHYGFQLPITKYRARATAWEAGGKWKEAAESYEKTAAAYAGFIKYAGYMSLDEAARCYRRAGMLKEAQRCDRESRDLKDSQGR